MWIINNWRNNMSTCYIKQLPAEVTDLVLGYEHHDVVIKYNMKRYLTLRRINTQVSKSAKRCFQKDLQLVQASLWYKYLKMPRRIYKFMYMLNNPYITITLEDLELSLPTFELPTDGMLSRRKQEVKAFAAMLDAYHRQHPVQNMDGSRTFFKNGHFIKCKSHCFLNIQGVICMYV